MKKIIEGINFIINTTKTVWDFFTGLLDNLSMLIKYIGIVANMCYSLIASMPSWLQAFGTLTILVSVLYMILGRQTGGSKE